MAQIVPDPISLTTHHLHLGFRETDTVLSSGTGFVYEKDQVTYLVTNWHVVAGRDPNTCECVSETKGVPDMISTMFRQKDQPGTCHREEIELYRDSQMREPSWYEHPNYGRSVDVVVLPLSERLRTSYGLFPINAIDFDTNFKEEVADEAFVVGYPFKGRDTALSSSVMRKSR